LEKRGECGWLDGWIGDQLHLLILIPFSLPPSFPPSLILLYSFIFLVQDVLVDREEGEKAMCKSLAKRLDGQVEI
jgi:hypothetical protein